MPRHLFLKSKASHRPKTVVSAKRHSSQMSAREAELINAESNLGRTLFGPIPAGRRREFFNHKRNVWIWHESWYDQVGHPHVTTIRYEVRPSGVFKRVGRGKYQQLQGHELNNFRHATHAYLRLIKQKLYN